MLFINLTICTHSVDFIIITKKTYHSVSFFVFTQLTLTEIDEESWCVTD